LKTKEELNYAVEQFTNDIQIATWEATPEQKYTEKEEDYPLLIKQKIAEKRRIRKAWQNSRSSNEKTRLNRKTKELKRLLNNLKNDSIQSYLKNLSAKNATNYSLWNATKRLKQPQAPTPPIKLNEGGWARNEQEKALAFWKHLEKYFNHSQQHAQQKKMMPYMTFQKPRFNWICLSRKSK
jgi:hypothetical protein